MHVAGRDEPTTAKSNLNLKTQISNNHLFGSFELITSLNTAVLSVQINSTGNTVYCYAEIAVFLFFAGRDCRQNLLLLPTEG